MPTCVSVVAIFAMQLLGMTKESTETFRGLSESA